MPRELAMKLRRSMPSFFDFSSAMMPISLSTCFCLSFCGRGMNSSLETTWVGTGESTPLLRSRCHLGIHMTCWLLRLERKLDHGAIRHHRAAGDDHNAVTNDIVIAVRMLNV